MHQKTFVIKGLNDLNNLTKNKEIRNLFANNYHTYAQVYTTRIHKDDIGEILNVLKSSFPDIKIAGMSLFGVGDFNSQYTAILSFMFFKRSETHTFLYDFSKISEEEGAAELNRKLKRLPHLKGVHLFPAGKNIGISKIIDDVSDGFDELPFFGAMASNHIEDFFQGAQPYVFTDTPVEYGLVAVAYCGKDLNIKNDACLGWKPLGRSFTAHVSNDIDLKIGETCLEKLDDTPVAEVYKYYLDADLNAYNMANINEFPLILKRKDVPFVRIPFYAGKHGELYYYGDIKEGEKLQIGYGNPKELIDESEKLSLRMQDFVPEAMSNFVCVSRYMLLNNRYKKEIEFFTRMLPQATHAFGSGEIFKQYGVGGLLAGSIVSICFREGHVTDSTPKTYFKQSTESRSGGLVPLSERLVSYLEKTSYDLNEMVVKAGNANKSKSEFLSRMSHEIRTPINAIIGMSEMILRESTDFQILQYASGIANSGDHLLSLVNDILDFSKIEAGKMNLIPVDFDLLKLLTDLVQIGQQYCEKKNLKFNVEINEDMPFMIRFDEIRLKQILTNVISNAVKYTEKGSVTFTMDFKKIDENNEYLTIHVKDTGIGVKPEDKDKLFREFERFDEKKNRSIQGTGLGLSIVQRILAMADSKLQFVSEYGVGSDFYFTIKVPVVHWATVRSHKSVYKRLLQEKHLYHESFRAPKARILVVDDIDVNRFVFKSLLKKTEVDITEASSGVQAVALCNDFEFDLIFMDHLMPDIDGIEAFRAIRKLKKPWAAKVPVIALTANAISGARNTYLEEGFIDYLPKPISPEHLEAKLIQYLPKDKVEIVKSDKAESDKNADFLKVNASAKDPGAFITQLTDINLISGLNYCGDIQTLAKALVSFVDGIPGNLERLKSIKDRNARQEFTMLMHSLKSTSRAIGATQLSRFAEVLEKAGIAGDVDTIIENAPVFAANLSVIYEKLSPLMDYFKKDSIPAEAADALLINKDNQSGSMSSAPVSGSSADDKKVFIKNSFAAGQSTGAPVNDQKGFIKGSIPSAAEMIHSVGEQKEENNPIEKIGKVEKLTYNEMVEAFELLEHKAEEYDLDACEKLVDFLTAQSVSPYMKNTLVKIKGALDDIDWDLVQQLVSNFNINYSIF
ncbi:ATP-binding protein [Oribacterium sp. FC2011]|uniref:ATP-binding protein n=1 Tax=Oribacterium sp. FC2011 TaxID=1408311 RepID=UPI000679263E|nr:ATP-binding protein [Oribacterium sp. FC2011]